ncbi:MAG: hypothetical protein HY738_01745 [Bacteroidia bacterium]|nr:hypothetical protein [Bacteroidia bacterium]
MPATLDKIKRLEHLIARNSLSDNVLDITLDKIIAREALKLKHKIRLLKLQIKEFEKKYKIDSEKLKHDFESGNAGDNIDFIEWTATLDMLNNAEVQLAVLQEK